MDSHYIKLVPIIMILMIIMSGCGSTGTENSQPPTTTANEASEPDIPEEDHYEEDFDSITAELKDMTAKTAYCCTQEYKMWTADRDVLKTDILSGTTFWLRYDDPAGRIKALIDNDVAIEKDDEPYVSYALSEVFDIRYRDYKDVKQFHNDVLKFFNEFQSDYNDIISYQDTLKTKVKEFKDKYKEEHEEATEALVSWYRTASEFADLAINVLDQTDWSTASATRWISACGTLVEELEEAEETADFAK